VACKDRNGLDGAAVEELLDREQITKYRTGSSRPLGRYMGRQYICDWSALSRRVA